MMIIFYVALIVSAAQCRKEQNFSTKMVFVGKDVTLTCGRKSEDIGCIFWMKLVPGNLPEVLAVAYTFDNGIVKTTPHLTAKHESGSFVLHISQIKLNDSAFYYCEEILERQKTVFNVTFIIVKGPEPKNKLIIQDHLSADVHPGDSVTLQCSVLSDSDHQMCPGKYSVHWFRAGADQTHPRLIYVHDNGGEQCESGPETHVQQKCVYNYSWSKISSSDAGTYYCAVASCGHILFGNGTKLEIKAPCLLSNSWGTVLLFLLCAALAGSWIFNVLLIQKIKKLKCDINAAGDDVGEPAVQQSQPAPEDSLVYSVPHFTKQKSGQKVKRSKNIPKEQSIYADVLFFGNE